MCLILKFTTVEYFSLMPNELRNVIDIWALYIRRKSKRICESLIKRIFYMNSHEL